MQYPFTVSRWSGTIGKSLIGRTLGVHLNGAGKAEAVQLADELANEPDSTDLLQPDGTLPRNACSAGGKVEARRPNP